MNVKTLCLGVLSLREATGYEIKKDVEEGVFSNFIDASYGSIYPALSHLAAEGLVTVREQEQKQAGRPDKKVYAITEAGRSALAKSLMVLPAKDKYRSEFLFQMLFQDMLPHGTLLAAIDKQIADLRDDLACCAGCRAEGTATSGQEMVAGYGHAVLTAAVAYLEQKKRLLMQPGAAVAAE